MDGNDPVSMAPQGIGHNAHHNRHLQCGRCCSRAFQHSKEGPLHHDRQS
jgi:hypothetical protein